jgi:phosphohistidine phosphatase
MKRLYLLRHAKSSWKDRDVADIDRPLNKRGLKAAAFMGQLMQENDLRPDMVLVSTAVRTRATAELVRQSWPDEVDLVYDARIYDASPQALRQVISEVDDSYTAVLLIGHNPGIEGLINYLTGTIESMPTAALAVITLDIDEWFAINDGVGTLQHVYRPKEEMKDMTEEE